MIPRPVDATMLTYDPRAVYITANFVIVSSADKPDQGSAAGIFNVALQVGGSVIGLTMFVRVVVKLVKCRLIRQAV